MSFKSIPEMFFSRAEHWAQRPRHRFKVNGSWREASWRQSAEVVREISCGFVSLGVKPGTKVALLCATRPEWTETDLAILYCGAVTVPIYPSLLPVECAYILADSGSVGCVVENEKQLRKLREAIATGSETGEKAELDFIIVVEGKADAEGAITLEELRIRGKARGGETLLELDERGHRLTREDLATIVYTSGTTGLPKGVVQTHGNHLAVIESVGRLGLAREGETDFLFLPLAHSFARMLEYFGLYVGTVTAYAQGIDTVAQDIAEAKPHLIPAVPRIFEKIYSRIAAARDASGPLKRWLFDWALGVGRERSQYLFKREPVPTLVQLQYAIAHTLVFSRIHQVLGGNVRLMVSGGAPLAQEVMEFFSALGFVLTEGYGLTETTPILTANRPDWIKPGTVGPAIDCVELRIAADGEILGRGPNVAQGYYQRPAETAEAWDKDGWFHTGDIGELDSDGFLRITDRKKDLIKTSGGKYVAPQKIENLLKTQRHISQAVVIGDNRKYCVALLTLDLDEVRRWATAKGINCLEDELWRSAPVREEVSRQVEAVNDGLASYETIKYFRILQADFSPEKGELTPSLKVKRKVVAQRYNSLIDEMFA